jgi:hypothetical protein
VTALFFIIILVVGFLLRKVYKLKKVEIDRLPFDFENAT